MRRISRFTISVPADLLATVDKKLIRGRQSRSALVRRLLEEALKEAQEQEDVERYLRGYREQPQTAEEFGWADIAAAEGLGRIPWQ